MCEWSRYGRLHVVGCLLVVITIFCPSCEAAFTRSYHLNENRKGFFHNNYYCFRQNFRTILHWHWHAFSWPLEQASNDGKILTFLPSTSEWSRYRRLQSCRRSFAGCYHQFLPVVWSRLKTTCRSAALLGIYHNNTHSHSLPPCTHTQTAVYCLHQLDYWLQSLHKGYEIKISHGSIQPCYLISKFCTII